MQEGKRPVSVGFFFSLGHSTIVVVASLIVYSIAATVEKNFDVVKDVGGIIGTSNSAALFLVAIALMNIVILRGIWRTFQEVRKGGNFNDQNPEMLMGGGSDVQGLKAASPDAFQALAYVSDWFPVWPRV